ncbi:MAG: exosortase H [Deltaproteobacteria bacterium]|nr:exosortase H [Deltaproteobacteria bacterium]MBW2420635.1 exosortase H [Deltaproteobacteria bacterium]
MPENPAPPPSLAARLVAAWRNPAYRFVLLFIVYLGGMAVAYPRLRARFEEVIDGLATGTAWVEYAFFRLFSNAVTLSDKVIVYQGFAVKIIEECTGLYEVVIFAAAVLAFPTTWLKRAIGLLMGVPLLYFFNVLRIAVLIVVGRYWPEYFDFMHLYFWQATLILMITSVWLLWIIKVVRSGEEDGPGAGGAGEGGDGEAGTPAPA